MRIPGRRPTGIKTPGGKYYGRLEVEANTRHPVWIGGPCTWVEVHHTPKGSKACAAALTNGKLACNHPMCGIKEEWRGYVPVFDCDSTPKFAVLSQLTMHIMDELEVSPLMQAEVYRGSNPRDPVMVRPKLNKNLHLTIPEGYGWPGDLTVTLCRLWTNPELTAWIIAQPSAKVVLPSKQEQAAAAAEALKKHPATAERMNPARPSPIGPDPLAAELSLDEALGGLAKKAAKMGASPNGKHPPKKE